MHTATTNVPGPQQPVQTLGRRMLESYPFVPVVGSIRIVVAIFSYDGGLYFGVTGDYDTAPDVDVLTSGIEHGMEDLLALISPMKAAPRNGGERAGARVRARANGKPRCRGASPDSWDPDEPAEGPRQSTRPGSCVTMALPSRRDRQQWSRHQSRRRFCRR